MTFVRIRPLFFAAFLTFLPAVFAAAPAVAQTQPSPAAKPAPKDPRIGALIDMLGKTHTPSQTAISPDGTTVAWSVAFSLECKRSTSPEAVAMKANTEAISVVKASFFTIYSSSNGFATQPNYNRETAVMEGDIACNGYQGTEKGVQLKLFYSGAITPGR